jgi:hypothetical protein
MSLLLYLRSDLFKAAKAPPERVPKEEIAHGAPRHKGETFEAPAAAKPTFKPAIAGKPEGFKPGAIHAPGAETEEHGSVGKVPAGEAGGIKESTMRIRPKGKRTIGYKATGEEMEYKQSAWNKPPYECKGKDCGTTVYPPQHAKVGTEHELMGHLTSGGQWSGTHEGVHHVEHPPKLEHPKFGDKPIALTHGSITGEHVDKKLCPSCFSKRGIKTVVASAKGRTPEEAKAKAEELASTKKSMYMLAQMMFLSKALAEGEDFGKPASTVSEEISHLVKEKGYPQKRAIAAALSMKRRGDIKEDKAEKSLYLAL